VRIILLAVLLFAEAAKADPSSTEERVPVDLLYRVAGGVYIKLDESKRIQVYAEQTVPLDDGRTLVRVEGGGWRVEPIEATEIKELKPIDLAVYGANYMGRRIRVSGTRTSAAKYRWRNAGLARIVGQPRLRRATARSGKADDRDLLII